MDRAVEIRFDDKVSATELRKLMKEMEKTTEQFSARDIFHYALRSEEKERISLSNVISVTARYGEDLLGYLRILTDRAYIYYILDVMVHPDFRGQGIGTALMNEAIKQCKEHGFIKIFLTAIPGKESYYSRFGFKPSISPVMTLRGEDYNEKPQ